MSNSGTISTRKVEVKRSPCINLLRFSLGGKSISSAGSCHSMQRRESPENGRMVDGGGFERERRSFVKSQRK